NPEVTVQTGTSGRSRPSCSSGMERRAWGLNSPWRKRGAFLLVTAICTRAEQITYYFRRVMVVANGHVPGMAVWRERLFEAMHLNANLPAAYFGVPPAQVVEVGLEVEI